MPRVTLALFPYSFDFLYWEEAASPAHREVMRTKHTGTVLQRSSRGLRKDRRISFKTRSLNNARMHAFPPCWGQLLIATGCPFVPEKVCDEVPLFITTDRRGEVLRIEIPGTDQPRLPCSEDQPRLECLMRFVEVGRGMFDQDFRWILNDWCCVQWIFSQLSQTPRLQFNS